MDEVANDAIVHAIYINRCVFTVVDSLVGECVI